jgi:ribonuclease HIII
LLEERQLLMATPQSRLHIFAIPARICFHFNQEYNKNRKKRKKQRIMLVLYCVEILHNIKRINGCRSKSASFSLVATTKKHLVPTV